MGLFAKAEFREYLMDFEVLKPGEETKDAMGVDVVAYANIDGENVYCYALYAMASSKYSYEEYLSIVEEMLDCKNKRIKVRVKFKNSKAVGFKIDVPSIASAYSDARLNDLELLGWGLHNSWPIK